MESPLGRAVGNSLEVAEALDCLRGQGPRDLRELVVMEGAMLLVSAKVVESLDKGKQQIENVLDSGAAMDKFQQMLVRQVMLYYFVLIKSNTSIYTSGHGAFVV